MTRLYWKNRNVYWRLMRADKPIGIYLLLWPTLWALFLAAEGIPQISHLIIFVLGVILMRSAGCVINDFADRKVDGHVERTAERPLAKKEITSQEALLLFALLIAICFVLVLFLNWHTILLSFVALFLASLYPFMKRYTHFPQVVLGAAFGWSIPMAAMAVLNTVPVWAWVLFAANLAWTVAYDTYYAMVDRDDDILIGVKSTAIAFGKYDLWVTWGLQVIAMALLAWVFSQKALNAGAFILLVIAAAQLVWHGWTVKDRKKPALFSAFLNNHYVGMTVFAAIVVGLF
ncbi:4-hydroxybenzoate octaprenyltransferase [Alteromonas sediminis]|uniref:4-hydroxybenzoate octaprenyltransferase n=1 Tax=Alteromonas sediminis TaxID=2259342 RepID=A0A3N5XZE4_9ALTE|nr:4-hydroxybenzoate octaprenyltransferase [Alteromonas sediminis]RPJ65446.1 4-hydroxybenzoate octaprenyltransferase [Alteromonas sediminis]